MLYKSLNSEKELNACKLDFTKSVNTLAKSNPDKYDDVKRQDILNFACQIHINSLATLSDEISKGTKFKMKQCILKCYKDIYTYGMANTISTTEAKVFNSKEYKDKLEISQLTGIMGGGRELLIYILTEALIYKRFDYVYIHAANSQNDEDFLINFYKNISRSIPNIGVYQEGRDFYYYRK